MRWPWVSKSSLDLMSQQIDWLEKELSYWRNRYEVEKDRADRAVDALVQWAGREPISQATEKTHEPARAAAKEMQEQMAEVFSDVAESILGEDEGKSPEESPVPDIASRLEKLRLLPRYQKAKSASVSGSETSGESETQGSNL